MAFIRIWIRYVGEDSGESFPGFEPGDDQRDVIMLFVRSKSSNLMQDRAQQFFTRQASMSPQCFDQLSLAKFLSRIVIGFGDSVGIEHEYVAGEDLAFLRGAIPLLEEAEERCG